MNLWAAIGSGGPPGLTERRRPSTLLARRSDVREQARAAAAATNCKNVHAFHLSKSPA